MLDYNYKKITLPFTLMVMLCIVRMNRFPVKEHLVLAFTGAPASFPVEKEHADLHRYLQWSDEIKQLVDDFVSKELPDGPFLGIHLRIGQDWVSELKLQTSFEFHWWEVW